MTRVRLDGVTKVYSDSKGSETAVEDISLAIEDGEFIVIVGPSGCGKSTTLRMIAGLEPVTEGRIYFDDAEVQELRPSVRDVAMVFQNYALYPSMSARKNIGYGLKHSMGLATSEREKRVTEAAEMLGITDVLEHKPDELSGGQKQRVALGRAIVREPSVFLLDEPLSNLDAKLRSQMRHEIQRIHENLGITTVYVTHDQKEAMTMADRVVILRAGAIQQVDTPEKLYDQPNNRFVAQFIGSPSMNVLDVQLEANGSTLEVRHDDTLLCTVDAETVSTVPSSVVAGIRPEHIELFDEQWDGGVPVDVLVSEYQGKTNFIHIDLDGKQLTARTKPEMLPEPGRSLSLSVDPSNVYLFDAETGTTVKHRQAKQYATLEPSSQQSPR